jgi:hypothetical protein
MPLSSCFFEARFTRFLRTVPERASPQADTAELAAKISKFTDCVFITINRRAAIIANESAPCERERLFNAIAVRARFGRGKEPVRNDDASAVELGFIFEHGTKSPKAFVHDRPRQTAVS